MSQICLQITPENMMLPRSEVKESFPILRFREVTFQSHGSFYLIFFSNNVIRIFSVVTIEHCDFDIL